MLGRKCSLCGFAGLGWSVLLGSLLSIPLAEAVDESGNPPRAQAKSTVDKCDRCRRRSQFTEWNTPHVAGYEQQLDAWNECMQQALPPGYASFDDDPAVSTAKAVCAHLDIPPTASGRPPVYMHKSSVLARTLETIGSACFKFADDAEYVLEGELVEGVTGETDRKGRPAHSRLTLSVSYDGVYREPLFDWQVWASAAGGAAALANRMWNNEDTALLRAYKPIEEFLWDYERTPASAVLKLEDETAQAGHRVEGELLKFRDEKGRASKDFNRIVVRARYGRILGGDAPGLNPREQVFSLRHLDKRKYEFTYRAPELCHGNQDTIEVWNSCEIRSYQSHPLHATTAWKKIADRTVQLVCPDTAVLTVQSQGTMRQGRVTYKLSASVQLDLASMMGGPTGALGNLPGAVATPSGRSMSFTTVRNATITSFHTHASEASVPPREWFGQSPRIETSPVGANPMVIIRDPQGDKAEYVILPPVSIRFDWNTQDAPLDNLIAFGPVKPFRTGPRAPLMAWAEDQKASGGDGVRDIRGSGWKREQDGGDSRSYHWTWTVSLR